MRAAVKTAVEKEHGGELQAMAAVAVGVDVELRDILEDARHRGDLFAARGRTTVPVLRCTAGDKDRWMPESRDIIAHLEQRFG